MSRSSSSPRRPDRPWANQAVTTSQDLREVRVLYVEDDEETWRLMERLLRRHFGQVLYARNGREALEVLKTAAPGVIITDIQMPVMDGLAMIREVRATRGPDLPIVVVSAYTDDEHRSALADAHIPKPIDIRVLSETVARLVGTRHD